MFELIKNSNRIGVAYMRMSTDKQEHSIESQYKTISAFCEKNNILIQKKYIDKGISGKSADKRPSFLRMIEDSSNGLFDCVVIFDSSRFARNLEQSIVYKSILKRNNVELISVTEPTLDDDTSLMTDALLGAMNEMYVRKLSKHVKRGMTQKALRGEYIAPAPFGYNYSRSQKTIIINDDEAKYVKYIFNEIKNGRTAYSLAMEMREKDVYTKHNHILDRARIEYILKNPTYKGYLRWNCKTDEAIINKSNHEAIISAELFEEVQNILAKRAEKRAFKAKPPEARNHWLSGLIRCSECGCLYSYQIAYGGRNDRFRCSGLSRCLCSSGISFTVIFLEAKVITALRDILDDNAEYYNLNINHKKYQNIDDYDAKINKYKLVLTRAKEAYLAGADSLEEYSTTKAEVNDKIIYFENLKKQKPTNKFDLEPFRPKLISTVDILENPNTLINEKKLAIIELIEKIVIGKQDKSLSIYFFG